MLHELTKQFRLAIVLFALLTVIIGVIYPLAVTGVAAVAFPSQATGSLIVKDGQPIGSRLIGQPFNDTKYFWGRPSATAPQPYNAASSSGSNLGPTNPALETAVKDRIVALQMADPTQEKAPPIDLVTASGSGLDPHISPAAAYYQVSRVARARSLSEEQVRTLVDQHTAGRTFGLLGEPRVNVLLLNFSLDNH